MRPGLIIGGSSAFTDRLLLDDEPTVSTASAHILQPNSATVPTPPREGGRSSGSRDPRSDIFGAIEPIFSPASCIQSLFNCLCYGTSQIH
jgi:hypothetical protein